MTPSHPVQPTDVCWELQARSCVSYRKLALALLGQDFPFENGYMRHDANERLTYTLIDGNDERPVMLVLRYTGAYADAAALITPHLHLLEHARWRRLPPRLTDATHVVTFTCETLYGALTRSETFSFTKQPGWTETMKRVLELLDDEHPRGTPVPEHPIHILSVLPI